MNALSETRWSPYVVGAAIGVLSWFTLLVSRHALGCSTSFARSAGMIERLFRGRRVDEKPYYREVRPEIDWQWLLVAGMVIGAFLAAWGSGDLAVLWVPARWAAAFGSAPLPRLLAAFAGGILLGFGSRWADGCTSGHGISGAMQLAVSSWISAGCFFIGGMLAARFLYRVAA
jgi:uncharacterized membrane protein YedE/YeeE